MNSDLTEFVEGSFGSVWSLELLLFLYMGQERCWTTGELVGELRTSETVVSDSLGSLMTAGLIVSEPDNSVRYCTASLEQGELVRRLEAEYRRTPAAIRRLILNNPNRKLQSFLDAFQIKRS
jgi:predicted transcriptional regulator